VPAPYGPATDPRIARGMQVQLAERRARIERGDKPLGWKVGFGTPAAMTTLKTEAPLIGYLMQSGRLPSGSLVSLKKWTKPAAEPEIAITIGRDLMAGGDVVAAAAAISSIAPAIELADVDLPFEDPEAILKKNIFQRHVVLGKKSHTGAATAGLVGIIFRDGKESGRTGEPEALTGKLVDIVRHVADLLGAFDERLSSGDIIIAGSIVPPLLIKPEEKNLRYELSPIGEVSIGF
jgi:2-keto-4-pentenoate hydratase